jgi:hypothetical protein
MEFIGNRDGPSDVNDQILPLFRDFVVVAPGVLKGEAIEGIVSLQTA